MAATGQEIEDAQTWNNLKFEDNVFSVVHYIVADTIFNSIN
jgi:hypothetical protein